MSARRFSERAVTPHRFYDYKGRETDLDTWLGLRDDVGADWATTGQIGREGRRTLVSTCFQGTDDESGVVLWETRVTRLPDMPFTAAHYETRDDAVRGHAAALRNEAEFLASLEPPE